MKVVRKNIFSEQKNINRNVGGKTFAKKRKRVKRRLYLRYILDGSFLAKDSTLSHAPYFFYILILAFIYIANNYYVDRIKFNIDTIKTELIELRYEYITVKAEVMQFTKSTNLSGLLKEMGVKPSKTPPTKVIVPKASIKN